MASPTIAGHWAVISAAASPRDSKDLAAILPISVASGCAWRALRMIRAERREFRLTVYALRRLL